MKTGIVSAMVNYPIGDLIAERVRAMGVKPFFKQFKHNGVNGPNMATVYSDRGLGLRAPVVFYNRCNEAAAQLKPGDFNWNEIFAGGVRWFHSGGIFAALSETTADLIIEAVMTAKKYGTIVSYDLNYRASLWKSIGGQKKAQEINRKLAPYVDVMMGNEEDFTACLGLEVPGLDKNHSKLDSSNFKKMILEAVKQFPNFKAVATTLRNAKTATINDWGAILYMDGKFYEAALRENLEIYDRVGGGDSFASGLIYGLMEDKTPQQAVEYGAAHGALAMTTPGDTTTVSLADVEKVMAGGTARVDR